MTTIRGVDVSRHQRPDRCNWTVAHAAGISFCYVKGSEGAGGVDAYVDPSAAEHVASIRRTPIAVGMYHFARPDNRFKTCADGAANGRAEAEHAIDTAKSLGLAWCGALPVAIDHEKYTDAALNITDAQRDAFLLAMIDTIDAALGRVPILYAGANIIKFQHTPGLPEQLRQRGVLLWLVNYTRNPDPEREVPGLPWSIWQHSGGGDFAYAAPVPGLPTPIDQNVYRGTAGAFAALLGA